MFFYFVGTSENSESNYVFMHYTNQLSHYMKEKLAPLLGNWEI